MTLRTAAMNLNSDHTSESWHLVRKTILLFLLVVALALGLVILYRQKNNFPLTLFNLLADISLGLLAGLGARFVLRQRHWFIQASASAAMTVVGLIVLGYFTNWLVGIGPLQMGLVRVHWFDSIHVPLQLPLEFKRSQTDWLDLAYLVIGIDTSWIALRAWKQQFTDVVELPAQSSRRIQKQRATQTISQPSSPLIRPPSPISRPLTRPRIKRKKLIHPIISKPAFPPAVRPKSSRGWSLRGKPKIQLAVYEEHRCPYCLEPVKRDDPRGTVECEVCHTLHHKDCWDITGACQVPHLNT